MEAEDMRTRLEKALREVDLQDRYLLEQDLSERCIAARLAIYLQKDIPDYAVDVEYNRAGDLPKRLDLPCTCREYCRRKGKRLVVPDVIVHRRGAQGPNLLVLELKKTTNPDRHQCDRERVRAFRAKLEYSYGALIECETRQGHEPAIRIAEWFDDHTDRCRSGGASGSSHEETGGQASCG